MSRAFPLAQVHAEPRDVNAPIAGVRLPGLGGELPDLPQTHVVVYPEMHLYGGGSLPDGMHRKWAPPCRSPGSGRRRWPNSSATSGCGCCRARCASAAMTGLHNTAVVFSPVLTTAPTGRARAIVHA